MFCLLGGCEGVRCGCDVVREASFLCVSHSGKVSGLGMSGISQVRLHDWEA